MVDLKLSSCGYIVLKVSDQPLCLKIKFFKKERENFDLYNISL